MGRMIYTKGTKLYKYEDDKLYEVRVLGYDEKTSKYTLKWLEKDEVADYDYDVIHDQLTRLDPDGVVSFNIVKDGPVQDVMILTHPLKDGEISSTPFAVCRQDSIDIFRMATTATPVKGQVWAGISINKNNCPAEAKLTDFMQCEDIIYTIMIAVYNTDTLDDIISLVFEDKFDRVLETYEKKHKGDNLVGICTSLRQLMEETKFMYDFHETMGIIEVPFLIDESPKIIELIKDIIGQIKHAYISNIYLIPYSKQIDTSEFERPWVLMTPDSSKAKKEDQKIYIVGYDVDPDKDYLNMKFGTSNKDEIIQKLGFQTL